MGANSKAYFAAVKNENYQIALHWFVQGVFWSGVIFIKLFYLFFY